MKQTTALRKLLAENQVLISAGCHDAVSAKVMEQAGFDVVFLSGFGFSASLIGKPDSGLLTLTEVIGHARNIAHAVHIPCLADGEDGYGGPTNVYRTIDEFERAGVAGIFLEDQAHPVMCGAIRKFKRIVPMEDMLVRIKAAVDARSDPDFVIAARTDSDIISVEEQIRRCNAYAEAGADLVTPLPASFDEYKTMVREIRAPLWCYLWRQADFTYHDLAAIGFRGIITYPVEPLFASTSAMMMLMRELKEKGTVRETMERLNALDYKGFFDFIGLREVVSIDQRYLKE